MVQKESLSNTFKSLLSEYRVEQENISSQFFKLLDNDFIQVPLDEARAFIKAIIPTIIDKSGSKFRIERNRVLIKKGGTSTNVAGIKYENKLWTLEIVLKHTRAEFRQNYQQFSENRNLPFEHENDWLKYTLTAQSMNSLKQLVNDWLGTEKVPQKPTYTQRHFALLTQYGNTINDRHNNAEQYEVYEELAKAYRITERWAIELKEKWFPDGYIEVIKAPATQGKRFAEYHWAKIYPDKTSLVELAITVGISSENVFVKIDTVNANEKVVAAYEKIRGDYMNSHIVHLLSPEVTVLKSFDEIVEWSSQLIPDLIKQYTDISRKLGLLISENNSVEGTIPVALPINQIFYGPPGTGKTYHTIEAAVQAAEPEFYHGLGIDSGYGATPEQRQELQTKFKELSDSKRIRFVTFHQSYGYEEFVEGLSASTTDNDQVKYAVRDGVFKEIADDARKNLVDSHKDQQSLDREQKFDLALEAFKLSIFEESDRFSLTDAVSIISIEDEGFRYCGEWRTSLIMKFVDLKSLYLAEVETRQDVVRLESVSGLARQDATYFLKALKHIEEFVSDELLFSKPLKKQNYVLVIDEINRGNISKIFGELITLIEPSKRKGSDESIELILPQSKEPFSVPNNLYLIGTMNTADRSLAMMDTALRRRFDFVEMMPKSELLVGTEVKGVDLQRLLEVLNQRIEILYDREHTLGHAFFMPVKALVDADKQDEAFSALVSVFKNKIIPLLEEYFFEDWSKIRLVLADNQKSDINLQFVQQRKQTKQDLDGLFGRNHNLVQYGQEVVKYTLAADEDDVWNNAKAYIGIYKSTEEAPTQSPESQAEANKEPV